MLRGHAPERIINATELEKKYFIAVMEMEMERDIERIKANPFLM